MLWGINIVNQSALLGFTSLDLCLRLSKQVMLEDLFALKKEDVESCDDHYLKSVLDVLKYLNF